jgi:two-component system LytT family sensor kinase
MSMGVGAMPTDAEDHMTPLQSIADQAGNGYFFFIAWAALYLALSYAAEIGALERRAATLRAAAQSAELRALRYQVNPHFLFNTLNSLSSLVLAGRREQAEQMIINLATFFRTSLTGDPTEDVPLSEEIALQELYLQIERVRFPERLLADIDVPDHLLDACIPGLMLQPLVENAVKYAVSRARRAITIRIVARADGQELTLLVEDDGDPIDPDTIETGTGVGLGNVRDRLFARFGDRATCRWAPKPGGGFAVTLTLPLLFHGC